MPATNSRNTYATRLKTVLGEASRNLRSVAQLKSGLTLLTFVEDTANTISNASVAAYNSAQSIGQKHMRNGLTVQFQRG